MAKSANFPTSNSTLFYYIQIDEGKTNISNNSTSVTVSVKAFKSGSSSSTYGSGTVHLAVNGSSYSATINNNQIFNANTITLISRQFEIKHDNDGSKTLETASYITHNRFTSSSHTYSQKLTTIPRASIPDQIPPFFIGDNFTIKTNRKDGMFTHNIFFKLNGKTVAFFGNIGATKSLALSQDDEKVLYAMIPNQTSVKLEMQTFTFNRGVPVGDKITQTVTLKVKDDIIPGFSHIEITDLNTQVVSKIGEFVQGLSDLKFDFVLPQGVQYSRIVGYEIYIGDFKANSESVTTKINQTGTIDVTGIVTDSRGRTGSKTKTIEILPYAPPKITKLKIERARYDGAVNMLGEYAKVEVGAIMHSLKKGEIEQNTLSYKIESKVRGTPTWSSGSWISVENGMLNVTRLFSGYAVDKTYDFRVVVKDVFNMSISIDALAAGGATMSWGVKGVGLGKVHERGALDVTGDTFMTGNLEVKGTTNLTGNVNVTEGKVVIEDGKILGTLEVANGIRPQEIFTPSIYNYWEIRDGWAPPRVIKDSDGWVHIEGVVEKGVGDRILILPEGMRPNHGVLTFIGWTYIDKYIRIDIRTNGNVVVFDHRGFVSFSGISFYVGDGSE